MTTEADDQGGEFALLDGISSLSADTIKVTFNGIEYTLNAYTPEGAPEGVNAYGDLNEGFLITSFNGQVILRVPTAGTYSLKIEEPQSGGSSDFSTAEVTVINTSAEYANTLQGSIVIDAGSEFGMTFERQISVGQTITVNVIMYKGFSLVHITNVETTSGAIQSIGDNRYLITGDGTITIS